MKTFSELLRRWPTAPDLQRALARHGCDASDTLIRRWWNEEMLPDRAWRAFVAAAQDAGHADISLETLAEIAETGRHVRLSWLLRDQGQALERA